MYTSYKNTVITHGNHSSPYLRYPSIISQQSK